MMEKLCTVRSYEKRPLYMVLLAGWNCGLYSGYDMAIESHWSGFIAEFEG
jgi:hypothetical protein